VNESYCAAYNSEYTTISKKEPGQGDYYKAEFLSNSSLDPFGYGCEELPPDVKNLCLIAFRGNCTFYKKALFAQRANASFLIVIYNETMVTSIPDFKPGKGDPSINMPVLFVSNVTGESIKVCPVFRVLYWSV